MEPKIKYNDPYVIKVQSLFYKVLSFYIQNETLLETLFDAIYKKYSAKNRHYHSMRHIYNMCCLWENNKQKLNNPRAIFLAIIYHDIIYVSSRNNNEEKSAAYFFKNVNRFLALDFNTVNKIMQAILATKHNKSSEEIWKKDSDIQYLLDFDLSILGTDDSSEYEWYREGVRKEYRIYPNIVYKPGRKKVLESFLERESIFLTSDFKKLENSARKNLKEEINSYLC